MKFLIAPPWIVSAVIFAALVSCSTTGEPQPSSVVSIEKPSASLAGAQTFAWYIDPTSGAAPVALNNNSQFAPAIQAAVERELQSRGYRKAAAGSVPGFRLAALLVNRDSESVVVGDTYFGGRSVADVPQRYLRPGLATRAETITLVVDGRDPQSNDLWWRGSVTTEVNRENSPEQRHALLNRLIDDLLQDFPRSSS